MVALTNQTIENSYGDLLQISNNNNGADSTLRPIKDGKDDSTPLRLSLAQIQLDYAVWPGTDGSNGQVLTTDGNGNLSWSDSRNVVSDTTPQLGGNLDVNGNVITGITDGDKWLDSNGNPQIEWQNDFTADAWLQIENEASGPISITAKSTSRDVGIALAAKGTTGTNILGGGFTVVNNQDFGESFTITNPATSTNYLNLIPGANSGDAVTLEVLGSDANIDLFLTPKGTGNVVISGLNYPNTDGSNGQVLTTDGNGNLSFSSNSSVEIVNDTSPQLGGTLDLNGQTLSNVSGDWTDQNGNEIIRFSGVSSATNFVHIRNNASSNGPLIEPAGLPDDKDLRFNAANAGNVVLSGLRYPNTDGSNGQALVTDGAGNLSFATFGGNFVEVAGDTMTGNLNMPSASLVFGGAGDDIVISESGIEFSKNSLVFSHPTNGTLLSLLDPNTTVAQSLVIEAGTTNLGSTGVKISPSGGTTDVDLNINSNNAGHVVIDGLAYPNSDGSNGQVLSTDGSGNLSFVTPSGGSVQDLTDTNTILDGIDVANAVNNLTVTNSATGDPVKISTSGGDGVRDLDITTTGSLNLSHNSEFLVTDTSGNINARIVGTSSAANYVSLEANITGSPPFINMKGSDANIGLKIQTKGTGRIDLDGLLWPTSDGSNGQVLTTDGSGNLSFTSVSSGNTQDLQDTNLIVNGVDVSSAVNYLQVTNSASGDPVLVAAEGSDANIDLDLEAKGTADIRGFTGGNVLFYRDSTSTPIGGFVSSSSNVNYLYIQNTNTGTGPALQAAGSDTNVDLRLLSKGSDGAVEAEDFRYYLKKNTVSSSSGSITFDTINANVFEVTLTENITSITLNQRALGTTHEQEMKIRFIQPSSGGPYTVSGWPSDVKWPGGTAPTITQSADAVDQIVLSTGDSGATWYGNYSQDYS